MVLVNIEPSLCFCLDGLIREAALSGHAVLYYGVMANLWYYCGDYLSDHSRF